MRLRVGIGSLALCLLLPVAPVCNADDLADVKALHEQGLAAFNAKDAAAYVATGHDQFVGFDVFGPFPNDSATLAREAIIQNLTTGWANFEVLNVTPINPQYRVFGNTAIAWGHYVGNAKPKDGPVRTIWTRYLVTYAKSDGKWLAVANHDSLIPSDTW